MIRFAALLLAVALGVALAPFVLPAIRIAGRCVTHLPLRRIASFAIALLGGVALVAAVIAAMNRRPTENSVLQERETERAHLLRISVDPVRADSAIAACKRIDATAKDTSYADLRAQLIADMARGKCASLREMLEWSRPRSFERPVSTGWPNRRGRN